MNNRLFVSVKNETNNKKVSIVRSTIHKWWVIFPYSIYFVLILHKYLLG